MQFSTKHKFFYVCSVHVSHCMLLVASPMRQMWMSPLIFMLSLCRRVTPPTMTSSRAFFTSSCPKISGAMLDARRP